MNTRLLIPVLIAGAVALACGSRARTDAAVKPSHVRTAPAPHDVAEVRSADTTPARLAPTFVVTTRDHGVQFDLAIRNEGSKHVELAFPDGKEYDFAVLDGRGREVYRWANGRMFTQSLQNRMLDGGDTLRFEEHASPALEPGHYVAVATLHSTNFPLQQRVAFELR